jgi:hypothetical protein
VAILFWQEMLLGDVAGAQSRLAEGAQRSLGPSSPLAQALVPCKDSDWRLTPGVGASMSEYNLVFVPPCGSAREATFALFGTSGSPGGPEEPIQLYVSVHVDNGEFKVFAIGRVTSLLTIPLDRGPQ